MWFSGFFYGKSIGIVLVSGVPKSIILYREDNLGAMEI